MKTHSEHAHTLTHTRTHARKHTHALAHSHTRNDLRPLDNISFTEIMFRLWHLNP